MLFVLHISVLIVDVEEADENEGDSSDRTNDSHSLQRKTRLFSGKFL